MTDQRRYGVIEVRRINAETYHLHDQRNDVERGRVVGRRGSGGASKTPPVTASPIPNPSSDRIGTCRQRSDLPSA